MIFDEGDLSAPRNTNDLAKPAVFASVRSSDVNANTDVVEYLVHTEQARRSAEHLPPLTGDALQRFISTIAVQLVIGNPLQAIHHKST